MAFVTAVAALLAGGADTLRAVSATYTGTAGDGVFDTGTNWSTGTAPGDTTAGDTTNTDVATFALTAGGTVTMTAQRNLGGITFGGASGTAGTFTVGTTTGPAFLLSSGGTTLANGFSGSQNLNAPLVLENAAAGASGVYTLETDTPGTSRVFTLGGTITGAATSGSTVLTLQGTSTTLNALNGVISDGTGGGKLAVVKTGTGVWSINNAANTYSGGTTVSAGTLRTGSSGNTSAIFGTGALTFNGGTVLLGSTTATTVNTAVVVNAGTSFLTVRTNDTFNPTSLTGTGTLTFNNSNTAGTVVTSSSFQGFGGTVDFESNGTNGTTLRLASAFDQTSLQNATLNLGATAATLQQNTVNVGAVTTLLGGLSGTGTLGAAAAASGTYTYAIGSNNASTAFSGTIVNGTAAVTAINKVGTGTLTLTGANSYTGLTTISAGTLNINGVNALGGANYSGLTINGGTLQYAAGATGNGSLDVSANAGATAKPVTFGANGATIDTNGNTVTFANPIGNSGAGGLTKVGAGTLALGAASTYAGATTISAGTLLANATGATGAGAVAVNAGRLGGTGSVAGVVTVASGATLLGGDGTTTTGVLTLAANPTLSPGSIIELTLGATNAHSTLALPTGFNGFNANQAFTLDNLQSGTYDNIITGVANNINTSAFTVTNGSGSTYTFTDDNTGHIDLTVTAAIPEPSTWALLCGGIAGLTALSMRRRRCV